MRSVCCYPLHTQELQYLSIPVGSKMLSVTTLHGGIVLYVMSEENGNPPKSMKVEIQILKTNTAVDKKLIFLGTVKYNDENDVRHVFYNM